VKGFVESVVTEFRIIHAFFLEKKSVAASASDAAAAAAAAQIKQSLENMKKLFWAKIENFF